MLNLTYAESHAQIAPIYDQLIYSIEQYAKSQCGRYSHHLKSSHCTVLSNTAASYL